MNFRDWNSISLSLLWRMHIICNHRHCMRNKLLFPWSSMGCSPCASLNRRKTLIGLLHLQFTIVLSSREAWNPEAAGQSENSGCGDGCLSLFGLCGRYPPCYCVNEINHLCYNLSFLVVMVCLQLVMGLLLQLGIGWCFNSLYCERIPFSSHSLLFVKSVHLSFNIINKNW